MLTEKEFESVTRLIQSGDDNNVDIALMQCSTDDIKNVVDTLFEGNMKMEHQNRKGSNVFIFRTKIIKKIKIVSVIVLDDEDYKNRNHTFIRDYDNSLHDALPILSIHFSLRNNYFINQKFISSRMTWKFLCRRKIRFNHRRFLKYLKSAIVHYLIKQHHEGIHHL